MSHTQVSSQKATPGFWKRLALAVETVGVPYEEQLEKRVLRLEAEVARLSAAEKKFTKP